MGTLITVTKKRLVKNRFMSNFLHYRLGIFTKLIFSPFSLHRDYAESIEAQLKSFNMLVDLLFPPPDIMPSQVLTDLSQRRCLYAIFVTSENESHHSLTLNILHGNPQGMVQNTVIEIRP